MEDLYVNTDTIEALLAFRKDIKLVFAIIGRNQM